MNDFVIKDSELKLYTGTDNHIEIPAGINSIGFPAFCGNEHILSVTIPCGVQYIMDGAFRGCQNLHTIALPTSIKAIGKNAFLRCDNLETIIYAGDMKQWESIIIDESNLEYIFKADLSLPNNPDCSKKFQLKRRAFFLFKKLDSLDQELSSSAANSDTDDEKWKKRADILQTQIQELEEIKGIRADLEKLGE